MLMLIYNNVKCLLYVKSLPCGEQKVKGSPVKPAGQVQIGLWFLVIHCAFNPQIFGQGSTHFLFIHARCRGHSALTIHSGLHDGGIPLYSGKQVHTA